MVWGRMMGETSPVAGGNITINVVAVVGGGVGRKAIW